MTELQEPPSSEAPRDPYDVIPYGGRPVPLTHPERFAVEAMRRGLAPARPDRCRILELGCAEGGNVIPLAFHLDGCEVVGVDVSEVQIEAAKERRDRLGLDNLELRCADIMSLGDELGRFDYVICHGVFSWVAEPVRQKILALASARLNEGGVLYLSYNCKPGWAFRSLIRRALMERVRGVNEPAERVARVRQVLGWMEDSPLKETPWGSLLASEAAAAASHRSEYLVHEYLSEENRPFHFREVVDLASGHGLSFLSELATAVSDPRIESSMRAALGSVVEDPVELEELGELFVFRAFRASLFVKREALDAASAGPHPSLEAGVRVAGKVTPQSRRVSLEPDVHELFETGRGAQLSASDAVLKGALLEVGRAWPAALSFDELEARIEALLQVRRVLGPDDQIDPAVRAALRHDLMELAKLGYLDLRLLEPPIATEVSPRPRVSALTRQLAARDGYGVTPHHRVILLDALSKHLVRYLDGSRDRAALVAAVREHVDGGAIALSLEDGSPLTGEALDRALPALVESALSGLASEGLLTA